MARQDGHLRTRSDRDTYYEIREAKTKAYAAQRAASGSAVGTRLPLRVAVNHIGSGRDRDIISIRSYALGVFILRTTVKSCFGKYFCVSSFRADKNLTIHKPRGRPIPLSSKTKFPVTMEMTKIHERLFAVLRCSILNDIKLRSRSLFAELVRFEMISKPKSPHCLRFEKCDGKRLAAKTGNSNWGVNS